MTRCAHTFLFGAISRSRRGRPRSLIKVWKQSRLKSHQKKGHPLSGLAMVSLAEEEGFEPPEPCGSTVFKTAAFDRSATPLFNTLAQTVILGVQMYRFLSFCQIPDSTFSVRTGNEQN